MIDESLSPLHLITDSSKFSESGFTMYGDAGLDKATLSAVRAVDPGRLSTLNRRRSGLATTAMFQYMAVTQARPELVRYYQWCARKFLQLNAQAVASVALLDRFYGQFVPHGVQRARDVADLVSGVRYFAAAASTAEASAAVPFINPFWEVTPGCLHTRIVSLYRSLFNAPDFNCVNTAAPDVRQARGGTVLQADVVSDFYGAFNPTTLSAGLTNTVLFLMFPGMQPMCPLGGSAVTSLINLLFARTMCTGIFTHQLDYHIKHALHRCMIDDTAGIIVSEGDLNTFILRLPKKAGTIVMAALGVAWYNDRGTYSERTRSYLASFRYIVSIASALCKLTATKGLTQAMTVAAKWAGSIIASAPLHKFLLSYECVARSVPIHPRVPVGASIVLHVTPIQIVALAGVTADAEDYAYAQETRGFPMFANALASMWREHDRACAVMSMVAGTQLDGGRTFGVVFAGRLSNGTLSTLVDDLLAAYAPMFRDVLHPFTWTIYSGRLQYLSARSEYTTYLLERAAMYAAARGVRHRITIDYFPCEVASMPLPRGVDPRHEWWWRNYDYGEPSSAPLDLESRVWLAQATRSLDDGDLHLIKNLDKGNWLTEPTYERLRRVCPMVRPGLNMPAGYAIATSAYVTLGGSSDEWRLERDKYGNFYAPPMRVGLQYKSGVAAWQPAVYRHLVHLPVSVPRPMLRSPIVNSLIVTGLLPVLKDGAEPFEYTVPQYAHMEIVA